MKERENADSAASKKHEGVGEHVRTRSHLEATRLSHEAIHEIADRNADLHRTKKTRFFYRTGLPKHEAFESSIRPST